MANGVTADYVFHQCDKAVFGKHLTKPMSTRTLRENIARGVEKALGEDALARVTPHTFRHSYVTDLLENDVPLPKVKALVGHTSDKTTLGYTHFSARTLHKAVTGAL
jgi:site-specific recombinase XerD